jgi:hypothetical protein
MSESEMKQLSDAANAAEGGAEEHNLPLLLWAMGNGVLNRNDILEFDEVHASWKVKKIEELVMEAVARVIQRRWIARQAYRQFRADREARNSAAKLAAMFRCVVLSCGLC